MLVSEAVLLVHIDQVLTLRVGLSGGVVPAHRDDEAVLNTEVNYDSGLFVESHVDRGGVVHLLHWHRDCWRVGIFHDT